MACLRAWAALASLLSFTFYVTAGASVQCFVCSYSPRGNTSRIDGCTDGNFTEEQIESSSCSLGCEAVAVYDVNDELETFHRNCATNDTIMTNSCETYTTVVLTRHVCSCDWSYCNAAPMNLQASRPLVGLALVATSLGFFQRLLTV